MSTTLSVIIPTYNESDNVAPMVARLEEVLCGISWEVMFVDDDSPDNTSALVRDIGQQNPKVRCLLRRNKRGLSSACIDGVLATSSTYVCVMDADFQHDETVIPKMLAKFNEISGLDIAIGSRYVGAGSTGSLPKHRLWISQFATLLSQWVFSQPISDPMSGFFMVRRGFLNSLMHLLSGTGFKILLDILVCAPNEINYVEVPYVMRHRTQGKSKLNFKVVVEFFMFLTHKLIARSLHIRFVAFSLVGMLGLLVHYFVLVLVHKVLGIGFIVGQLMATWVAMTSNFVFNNQFTYKDRNLSGIGFLKGLLSFYLVCALGAVINLAISGWLYNIRGEEWWIAAGIGVLAGAGWNFFTVTMVTWKKR